MRSRKKDRWVGFCHVDVDVKPIIPKLNALEPHGKKGVKDGIPLL